MADPKQTTVIRVVIVKENDSPNQREESGEFKSKSEAIKFINDNS